MNAPFEAQRMSELLDQFVNAFNADDLDRVMSCFADGAQYLHGDGRHYSGKAQIRAALSPQFARAYGTMRFEEHDRILDEGARKAVIRWTCHHDLAAAKWYSFGVFARNALARLTVGRRCRWQGLDVLHFDAAGKIRGKFTYAPLARPQLEPDGLATRSLMQSVGATSQTYV